MPRSPALQTHPTPMPDRWNAALARHDLAFFTNRFKRLGDAGRQRDSNEILGRWAGGNARFSRAIFDFLLEHGAIPDPPIVPPLCSAGGVDAIRSMKRHGVNLLSTNHAGENALAMACLIPDEGDFRSAWTTLRNEGLDPHATDRTLETAFDAAQQHGRLDLVEQLEAERAARLQAQHLTEAIDTAGPTDRRLRL